MVKAISRAGIYFCTLTILAVACSRRDDAAETVQREDLNVPAEATSPTTEPGRDVALAPSTTTPDPHAQHVSEPGPGATPTVKAAAQHEQHVADVAARARAQRGDDASSHEQHIPAPTAQHTGHATDAAAHVQNPATAAAEHTHTEPGDALSPSARAQIEQVRAATARFRDVEAARAAGYVMFGKAEGPLMGEHWYLKGAVRDAFDLARPSTIQYVNVGGERKLVGVAYTVYQRPGEPLPEGFDGAGDHWHVHDVAKLARAFVAERPFLRWVVERRASKGKLGAGDGRTLLVMLHAWVWTDNPDGMFALQNRALPYMRAGLPESWAATANENAAWGLALAGRDGCRNEIARTNALAKLSKDQKSRLASACDEAAEAVRVPLSGKDGPAELNQTAARAWQAYSATRDQALEPEQKARMASVMEHDPTSMGQHH
jgi:hypothetical protein